MPNDYFKFKKFTIQQDKCAMKVSTDACVQGAWTQVDADTNTVLDIGAGTGLLSLMLAQKNSNIKIDAIEIDEKAALQAKDNFEASEWNNRLSITNEDITKYRGSKYDLIISNPPFFIDSLLGENDQRNAARHAKGLTHLDLLNAVDTLLNENGEASIMLPVNEFGILEETFLGNGWHVIRRLNIVPAFSKKTNRVVGVFSKTETSNANTEELIIKDLDGSYTTSFVDLLKPFYLYL